MVKEAEKVYDGSAAVKEKHVNNVSILNELVMRYSIMHGTYSI